LVGIEKARLTFKHQRVVHPDTVRWVGGSSHPPIVHYAPVVAGASHTPYTRTPWPT
jgi:hypothetical protein